MSKEFHVPITIKLMGSISIEADDLDEAYKLADDKLYWAYQAGAPEQHRDVSISDCELYVDGEEIDIFENRDEPTNATKEDLNYE